MTLERLYLTILLSVTGVTFVTLLIVGETGRPGAIALAIGLALVYPVMRLAAKKLADSLRRLADSEGLEYLGNREAEDKSPIMRKLRTMMDRDVYPFRAGGRLPAVAGEVAGIPVTIRVPKDLDFDRNWADSSRVAAFAKLKLSAGVRIYTRAKLKRPLAVKLAITGDAAFDAKFAVIAKAPADLAVLDQEARRLLLTADAAFAFRGLELTRWGVFLHEDGKVCDPALLKQRLALVASLAASASGAPAAG